MTPAETRTALANAASSVEGVTVQPYTLQTIRPGEGFIRLAAKAPDAHFRQAYVDTWELWLAVPQDTVAGEQWTDTHLGLLLAALAPELHITGAVPADLGLPGGTVSGLIITGTREG